MPNAPPRVRQIAHCGVWAADHGRVLSNIPCDNRWVHDPAQQLYQSRHVAARFSATTLVTQPQTTARSGTATARTRAVRPRRADRAPAVGRVPRQHGRASAVHTGRADLHQSRSRGSRGAMHGASQEALAGAFLCTRRTASVEGQGLVATKVEVTNTVSWHGAEASICRGRTRPVASEASCPAQAARGCRQDAGTRPPHGFRPRLSAGLPPRIRRWSAL